MGGFLNMIAAENFVTTPNPRYTWRPESWRETILKLYPNGQAPLTAIMSKLKSSKVTDPIFHWWVDSLPTQNSSVTAVFTSSASTTGTSSNYTGGGAAGDTLYVKIASGDYHHFRTGHTVLLRDADHPEADVVAKVTGKQIVSSSHYSITVKLLEADDNGGSYSLLTVDRVLIIGNMNEEGALIPDSLAYEPSQVSNYTQIFRTSLDITRTAQQTKLRTGDFYKDLKKGCLELHSIEMEKSFIFGIPYQAAGTTKYERTTGGIIHFIKTYASDNISNFAKLSGYSGDTWLESGEDWLDTMLEQCFRYGSQEKLVLCGSGALLGLNQLARNGVQMQMTVREKAYGIKVMEWVTPFGTLQLKTHPLFTYESSLRNSMLIIDPGNLEYKYITDTMFKKDPGQSQGGYTAYDAIKEEYLTEAGLEMHYPETFMLLHGVGLGNTA